MQSKPGESQLGLTTISSQSRHMFPPTFAPFAALRLCRDWIQLAEVVEICESLGYQGFRARIAHDQQRHVNPRETLEYVAKGKHLAFICDSW